MSLTVTFFVMLIAFATWEERKLTDLIGSLKGAFRISPAIVLPNEKVEQFKISQAMRGALIKKRWLTIHQLSRIVPDVEMILKKFGKSRIGYEKYILIRILEDGMVFVIEVEPLFKPGKSELLSGNSRMLKEIGNFIRFFANEIKINAVITKNKDRVDTTVDLRKLGLKRALSIENTLMEQCGLERNRFGVGVKLEEMNLVPTNKPDVQLGKNIRASMPKLRMIDKKKDKILSQERIEIIIVGRKTYKELSPEEIIVSDKW
jgi:hypothetical protein